MIVTNKGDLIKEVQRGFIVHGCNMQGVMGSGVARGIKSTYPSAFKVYEQQLRRGAAELGDISAVAINPELYIVNALTQGSYGSGLQVSYDAISIAFQKLAHFSKVVDPLNEWPICFPLIGAGRGGGDWKLIEQRILAVDWGAYEPRLLLFVIDQEPAYCA